MPLFHRGSLCREGCDRVGNGPQLAKHPSQLLPVQEHVASAAADRLVAEVAPPGTKVFYSDIDPITVAYGHKIIKDNPNVCYGVCPAEKPEELLKKQELIEGRNSLLLATTFENRYVLHPRRLRTIGSELADELLSFYDAPDAAAATANGAELAREGQGEKTILRIASQFRHFCREVLAGEAKGHLAGIDSSEYIKDLTRNLFSQIRLAVVAEGIEPRLCLFCEVGAPVAFRIEHYLMPMPPKLLHYRLQRRPIDFREVTLAYERNTPTMHPYD